MQLDARGLIEGNTDAWDAFARATRWFANRLALKILKNQADAEDAVAVAYLNAWRWRASFDGRAAATTWFYRIVANASLSLIRGNRRPKRDAGLEVDLALAYMVEDGRPGPYRELAARLEVERALAAMRPGERDAFRLIDVEGFGYLEASEILGVAEGTIKTRRHRGRMRAQGHLSGHRRRPEHAEDDGRMGAPRSRRVH